ncbi:MAG: hypothetical protein AAF333_13360 [Planctomycetota bacterium]
MTAAAAPHQFKPLEQFVLHKRVRRASAVTGGAPVGAPTANGFNWDESLRCLRYECVSGPDVGKAEFGLPPTDTNLPSVERELARYHNDDLVRVVVRPPDHPVVGQTLPEGIEDLTVFEGQLIKAPFTIEADGGQEDEVVRFVAVPTPVIDNLAHEHLVAGRWTILPGGNEVAVIESLDVPAVFNFRGRPNMLAEDKGTLDVAGLTGRVFTHDDDPTGEHWTVKDAINAILTKWLFGPDNDLDRHVDLEPETRTALSASEAPSGGRWEGLDDRLPEVNVHGVGYLTALQRVCDAAGFELHVMPHYGLQSGVDRLYTLSLNRISAGPVVEVGLQPRRSFPADQAEVLRHNHVSKIQGARDASALRNEVYAVGRSLVEAAFELKPLWSPSDVTTDLNNVNYAKRHVANGQDYGDYQHVGRQWGIDCTGQLAAAPGSYSGAYAHPADGFDFVGALGLNTEGSPLLADRVAQNITDPVVWMRRLRHLLPLRRPEAAANGVEFVVEVSENGGTTWVWLPTLRVRTLSEQCGLQFLRLPDLSRVNAQTFRTGDIPPVAESWWRLMFPDEGEPKLRFRVTCCVEGDHAAAGLADDSVSGGSSGSVYSRRVLRPVEIEQVWASPLPANYYQPSALELITGWGVNSDEEPERVEPLELAKRMRDATEGVRVPCSLYSWIMEFTRWRLGDRVTQIAGRNLDLGVSVGNAVRHPSIAGIYVTLSGTGPKAGEAQGVRVALSDRTFVEGV